jgi:hypothetical protein
MDPSTMEIGNGASTMAWGPVRGPMGASTRANGSTAKRKAKGKRPDRMEVYAMQVCGKMTNRSETMPNIQRMEPMPTTTVMEAIVAIAISRVRPRLLWNC